MEHGVTVCADRTKVLDRVHGVRLFDARQLDKMMHVNEALAELSIGRLKVELTHGTRSAPVGDALLPCPRIALVTVY